MHQPVSPNNNPFQLRTHMDPTTSATLFDASAPPDYEEFPSESQDVAPPPSFSEVSLTLDPSGSFLQPLSSTSNSSSNNPVPLYSLSSSFFDRLAPIITINPLYHGISGDRIKETALPVYEFQEFLFKFRLQPLLESASYVGGSMVRSTFG
jgi:hypothetical protein